MQGLNWLESGCIQVREDIESELSLFFFLFSFFFWLVRREKRNTRMNCIAKSNSRQGRRKSDGRQSTYWLCSRAYLLFICCGAYCRQLIALAFDVHGFFFLGRYTRALSFAIAHISLLQSQPRFLPKKKSGIRVSTSRSASSVKKTIMIDVEFRRPWSLLTSAALWLS